jgi:alpha-beta hydrolase superfamily lysophospholipase
MTARRRIARLIIFALVALTLSVSAALLWLCYQQARALVYPARIAAAAGAPGADWQDVVFSSEDGLRLEGWYTPPDERGAALIFVHGFGGSRQNLLPEAQFVAGHGYGALVFDLRNHGSSEGTVSSMGLHEVRDVQAAFAWLQSQPGVDPAHIGLYGASMGSATAIRAMPRLPEARLLVSEAGFADFVDAVGHGVRERTGLPGFPFANAILWFMGSEASADMFSQRPVDVIGSIAPRPVLIMHGTSDPLILVDHGQRLYDAAGEPKALYLAEGGAHTGLLRHNRAEYERVVLAFVRQYL